MEQPSSTKRERNAEIWWRICWICYLVGVGTIMLTWYVQSGGPLAWLCEWQAGWLGGRCSPALTVLIILVPFLILLIPMKKLFEKISGVKLKRQGRTKHF